MTPPAAVAAAAAVEGGGGAGGRGEAAGGGRGAAAGRSRAAGRAGGRFLSCGGGRSRDYASGERRRPAAGGEGTAGRRVATVTAAVTPRAGKDPVSTGSGASLEAHNGGTGLSGASVSPATPEPLEPRWDPFVTMTCVTGRKAPVWLFLPFAATLGSPRSYNLYPPPAPSGALRQPG